MFAKPKSSTGVAVYDRNIVLDVFYLRQLFVFFYTQIKRFLSAIIIHVGLMLVYLYVKYDVAKSRKKREESASIRDKDQMFVHTAFLDEATDTFRLHYNLDGSAQLWTLVIPRREVSGTPNYEHFHIRTKPVDAIDTVVCALGPLSNWHGSGDKMTPEDLGAESIEMTDLQTFDFVKIASGERLKLLIKRDDFKHKGSSVIDHAERDAQ